MLFVFRGIRSFQVVLALVSMALALACVILLKLYADGGSKALMVPAVILGLFFLWGFATCLRAPTSFVAIAANQQIIAVATERFAADGTGSEKDSPAATAANGFGAPASERTSSAERLIRRRFAHGSAKAIRNR